MQSVNQAAVRDRGTQLTLPIRPKNFKESVMAIYLAVLYRAGQELVLVNDNRPGPEISWRFNVLYMHDRIKRFHRGHGYMLEMQGRFNDKGKLDVIDIHNKHASDFDIVCGPEAEYVALNVIKVKSSDGRVRKEYETAVNYQHNTRIPGSDLTRMTIRVFAGPPPASLNPSSVSEIWISDPASLIWELLSNSALPLSTRLDRASDGWGVQIVHGDTGRKFTISDAWRGKTQDIALQPVYSTPHVIKRRILKDVRLQIF